MRKQLCWWMIVATLVVTACVPDDDTRRPVPEQPAPALPEGLPTDEELALTPRADARAEFVALVADRQLWVASTSTYERVRTDLAAIDVALPTHVVSVAPLIESTLGAYAELTADAPVTTVPAIEQIAEALHGTSTDAAGDGIYQVLSWPGRLQPSFAPVLLREIEGVRTSFGGDGSVQDGPTIAVESFVIDGDVVYLLLGYGGDCPEGCTELQAARVLVTSSTSVELLDTFDTETATVCPAWLQGHRCPLSS